MYLENIVIDAADPRRLGRFWASALGAAPLTDAEGIFEARLQIPNGPTLDLCFQPVPEPRTDHPRIHLDLRGGTQQAAVVERLLNLGARHLDIGQGDEPWVVLADPEGNPFCVMETRDTYLDTGPIAALPIECADPQRDATFWSQLSGWTAVPGDEMVTLRHPSRRGLVLELCPQAGPKRVKNRLHLDLRAEAGDDPAAMLERARDLGGRVLEPGWGDLPWTSLADPSGNELCFLPPSPART